MGIVLGLLSLTFSPFAASANSPAPTSVGETHGKVAVIGMPGLTYGDIDPDQTPNLYRLFARSAAANLNVRTIGSATCPGSGWLSLGSGARAEAGPPQELTEGQTARCPSIVEPSTADAGAAGADRDETLPNNSAAGTDQVAGTGPKSWPSAQIPDFESIREPNLRSGYAVDYGMLGRLVTEAGAQSGGALEPCVAASGPGAGYAAANEGGAIPHYSSDSSVSDCRLEFIDIGAIGTRWWLDNQIPEFEYTLPINLDRDFQLEQADRLLGEKLKALDEAGQDQGIEPTIIVAGIGDSSSTPRLRTFIAAGPGIGPGTLSSSTTRTSGLLQLTDLAPGILDMLSIPSPSGVKFEFTPATDSATETSDSATQVDDSVTQDRLDSLVTEGLKAATVHKSLSTFSTILDVVFYVLFLLGAVLLSAAFFARRGGRGVHRFLGWSSLVAASLPMGAILAGMFPWASFGLPVLGLGVAVVLGSAIIFGIGLIPPWGRTWRGRVAAMALASIVIIALDLATGSRLQGNSLLGYNPIVGGRFYGLGNQGAAVFIVCLFIFLGLAISWLRARGRTVLIYVVPVVFGLSAVFVSGNPSWGAKFGGTIATLAGLLVLLALISRIRLSFFRLSLIGLASLVVLIGIAFLDWLRPPGSRSHFGNFFEQLVSGEAVQVIGRKLSANLRIIEINPALAIVTPLAIIAVLFFMRYLLHFSAMRAKPRVVSFTDRWRGRLPEVFADQDVHFGFLAAVTGLTVGLVLTDSGIAVPSTGAMVLVPYLFALCAESSWPATTPPQSAASPLPEAPPLPAKDTT